MATNGSAQARSTIPIPRRRPARAVTGTRTGGGAGTPGPWASPGWVALYANDTSTNVTSGGQIAVPSGTLDILTVASAAGFPVASNTANPATYFMVADPQQPSELMQVINTAGLTWPVIRGAEGTVPVAHAPGFSLQLVVSAGEIRRFMTEFDVPIRTGITSNYQVQLTDSTVIVAQSGNTPTVTLPDATTCTGQIFTLICESSNGATFACTGSQTIDTNATINAGWYQWEAVQSDGSNWHALNGSVFFGNLQVNGFFDCGNFSSNGLAALFGLATGIQTLSANFTIGDFAGNMTWLLTAAGITVTLAPAGLPGGSIVAFQQQAAGSSTIAAGSGDNIEGAASIILNQGQAVILQSDGVHTWTVLASDGIASNISTTPLLSGTIVRDQVSNLYTSSGAATGTITFAANPTAGAKVLLAVANVSGTPTITDNGVTPATWHHDVADTANTNNIHIFRADGITLPASGLWQISFTSGGNVFAAQAISYLGLQGGAPYASTTNGSTGTSLSTGNVNAAGLVFGTFSDSNTASHTVTLTSTSFTGQGVSTSGGSQPGAFALADWIDYQIPSSQSAAWTLGSSSLWEAAIAVYPVNGSITGMANVYAESFNITSLSSGTGRAELETFNSNGTPGFVVTDQQVVETNHNTLDDGSGNASISGNGQPPLAVSTSATGTYINTFNAFAPSMTAGQQTFSLFGQAASTNNSASVNFHYVGAGSTANSMIFNFFGGSNLFAITATGEVQTVDNLLDDGSGNMQVAEGFSVRAGTALTESAGAPWVTATSAATVTSGSFTPTANSLLVAIGVVGNGGNGGESTAAITDSVSGTWTTLVSATVSVSATAIIAVKDAGASPSAQTVTVTATGANGGVGLVVRQFSGARPALEQIGATTQVQATGQPFTASITPNVTGSQVVGGYATSSVAVTLTANSATSIYGQVNDNTHGDTESAFEALALSQGGVSETLGFTNSGTHAVAMVLAEILPAYPFAVYADDAVVTRYNTLDDGSGNVAVAGKWLGNLVVENLSNYANGTFVGQGTGGSQYSNFNLADNIYPLDATGHYWAFSHRATGDHSLLIFNYNGASYKNVFFCGEDGAVGTGSHASQRNVLDDGSENATILGKLTTAGFATAESAKTGNYTLTATDAVVLMNGTTLTATLPTASGVGGQHYTIKNINSSACTVATTSSQTIDGATTLTLNQYQSVHVISDGSNWRVLAAEGFTKNNVTDDGAGNATITGLATAAAGIKVNNISTPSTPSGAAEVFAASGSLKYVGSDGITYNTGQDLVQITSNVAGSTGTASQNITGLVTPTLGVGKYYLEINIPWEPTGTVGSHTTWGMSAGGGLTLSAIGMASWIAAVGTTAEAGTSAFVTSTTLSDAMWTGPTVAATAGWGLARFWGTVTTSAGGTLQMVFANGTSADTVTMGAGATILIRPLN